MDLIIDRLDRYPDMHIYHYAPYEPSAFKKLMGRHATREAELDRLLRGGRFIDLYGVVRQAVWIGVESYSIKRLEPVYGYKRDVDLPDASPALRRMELALQLRQPALVSDEERAIIAGYNRDDCVSTLRLRDWLEVVRLDAEAKGIPCPRPPAEPDAPTPKVNEKDQQILVLRERLINDLPDDAAESDDEEHARWLLAFLLDYHRREEKATWWEFFRLRDLPSDDFYDERQAVAGLTFKERVSTGGFFQNGKPKGPVVDRYEYPEQDMDIDRGDSLNTTDGKRFAECAAVDRVSRTIDISKSIKKAEIHPTAVFAWDFIPAEEAKGALLRLGERVAAAGTLSAAAPSAAIELLLRNPPRLSNGSFAKAPGESELALAIRTGANLDRSVLAIQGPPGSGKTFTGSEMIVELVKRGKRVGVTANSHKVIRNLLKEVVKTARTKGVALRVGHKNGDETPEEQKRDGVQSYSNNEGPLAALQAGEINVLGGTHWLWSRTEFADSVDVLFVDEAGQMVLANVLAVSQATNSIVLLGDPQQLDQPQQGSHPEGVAVSALEHLLGEHQTIPAELGHLPSHDLAHVAPALRAHVGVVLRGTPALAPGTREPAPGQRRRLDRIRALVPGRRARRQPEPLAGGSRCNRHDRQSPDESWSDVAGRRRRVAAAYATRHPHRDAIQHAGKAARGDARRRRSNWHGRQVPGATGADRDLLDGHIAPRRCAARHGVPLQSEPAQRGYLPRTVHGHPGRESAPVPPRVSHGETDETGEWPLSVQGTGGEAFRLRVATQSITVPNWVVNALHRSCTTVRSVRRHVQDTESTIAQRAAIEFAERNHATG